MHFLVGWPKYPHGQGFIAAISMNEHGYVIEPDTLDMVTCLSSKGWRKISRAGRENSASSSRKSKPLCARDISPGFGTEPPPESPAGETVWCGERKGLAVIRGLVLSKSPATEWIFVVSIDSSKVMAGSIDGIRFASIDFPEPGEPIIRTLWPPAAATSNAFFAADCPFTSAKSRLPK